MSTFAGFGCLPMSDQSSPLVPSVDARLCRAATIVEAAARAAALHIRKRCRLDGLSTVLIAAKPRSTALLILYCLLRTPELCPVAHRAGRDRVAGLIQDEDETAGPRDRFSSRLQKNLRPCAVRKRGNQRVVVRFQLQRAPVLEQITAGVAPVQSWRRDRAVVHVRGVPHRKLPHLSVPNIHV